MYFITTLQIKDGQQKSSRCIGYFKSFEEAEHIVVNNVGDIEETIFLNSIPGFVESINGDLCNLKNAKLPISRNKKKAFVEKFVKNI